MLDLALGISGKVSHSAIQSIITLTFRKGMGMDDPIPTYTYLITQILERWPRFGYLHVTERRLDPVENQRLFDPTFEDSATIYDENDFIRKLWSAKGKPLITAGGYRRSTALRTAEEKGDLIAFGRFFISNVSCSFRLPVTYPDNP